jgi:hypothetical protein
VVVCVVGAVDAASHAADAFTEHVTMHAWVLGRHLGHVVTEAGPVAPMHQSERWCRSGEQKSEQQYRRDEQRSGHDGLF